jgi:hypothetical protein
LQKNWDRNISIGQMLWKNVCLNLRTPFRIAKKMPI